MLDMAVDAKLMSVHAPLTCELCQSACQRSRFSNLHASESITLASLPQSMRARHPAALGGQQLPHSGVPVRPAEAAKG